MTAGRSLRPSLLAAVNGGGLWIVDDVQPVAVLVDTSSAEIVDVVDWTDLPPPTSARPGTRSIRGDGRRVVVRDAYSGYGVELERGAATRRPVEAFIDLPRHRAASWRLGVDDIVVDDPAFGRFAIRPDPAGGRADARVELEPPDGSRVPLGAGRLTAGLIVDGVAWLCSRRAPLRPWTWRPPGALLRVAPGSPGVEEPLQPVSLGGRCWSPARNPDELRADGERLARSARSGIGGDVGGAVLVGITVEGTGVDTVIEQSYTSPRRPGLRLVRRWELFDELGHLLDPVGDMIEDVEFDLLPPAESAVGGNLLV